MLTRMVEEELGILLTCDERLRQIEVPVVELLSEVKAEVEVEAEAMADVSKNGARAQQKAVLEAYSEYSKHPS